MVSRRPCLVGVLNQDPKAMFAYEVGPALLLGTSGSKQAWVPTALVVPDHIKPGQLAGIGFNGPYFVPAEGEWPPAYDLGALLTRYVA